MSSLNKHKTEQEQRQEELCRKVWRAWTARQDEIPCSQMQEALQEIVESSQSSKTPSTTLRPELRNAILELRSTARIQELLIQRAMKSSRELQEVWEGYYTTYRREIYAYAMKLLQSESLAETLFQEISTRVMAWMLLQEQLLSREVLWRPFLFRCIHRDAVALLKKMRSQEVLDEFCEAQQLSQPQSNQPGEELEEQVIFQDLLKTLRARMENQIEQAEERGRSKQIEIWKRRLKVLEFLLMGETRIETANKVGISPPLLTDDTKHIGKILLELFHEGE